METITIQAYKFSELNKEAKEKVLNKFSDINVNYDWWEFEVDDLAAHIKEKLNLEFESKDILFEMFSRRNSVYIKSKEVISALSQKYSKLNNFELPDKFGLFCNYLGGGISSGLHKSEYREEYIELGSEYNDSEDIDREFEIVENNRISESIINDLNGLQELLRTFYNNLYEEYNHLTSEEAIKDTLEANGYMFKENGSVV